jgi:heme/copper-type cytochrome/quinol oxidase subunit 1
MLYFLLPFAVFAIYLLILRRNPLLFSSWSNEAVWLVIAGLVCVVLALLVTGFTADRNTGAFQPTHVEDGRVVPGQFR